MSGRDAERQTESGRPGRSRARAPTRRTPGPNGGDQRSRLLRALVEVVAEDGYPAAKVGEIAKRAGVSRATFYEQFQNKEESFLAAHRALSPPLCEELDRLVCEAHAHDAAAAACRALVQFADWEPAAFELLTHEAMLAGVRAQQERDELLAAIAASIDRASHGVAPDAVIADLPSRLLVGGLVRALGIHMRRGRDRPLALLEDLLAWIESYRVTARERRWLSLTPSPGFELDAEQVERGPIAPQRLPKGRHRLPPGVVKRVQRERILHATAEVVLAKGYAESTVADIVAAAGLSREVFYGYFHDKSQAFLETHQLIFEQFIAACAGAFFTPASAWPERVWEGGSAFARFIAATPSFAHFAFVESYALAPLGAQRTDEGILAFTLFLEDGYRFRAEASVVPRLAADAIAGAIMETGASLVRDGRVSEIPGLRPVLCYLILVPFTGAAAANEFVDGKLAGL